MELNWLSIVALCDNFPNLSSGKASHVNEIIRSKDISSKVGLLLRKTEYFLSSCRQNGSDSRFTIILDRRLDTWSSLKISLQKISVSTNLFYSNFFFFK